MALGTTLLRVMVVPLNPVSEPGPGQTGHFRLGESGHAGGA